MKEQLEKAQQTAELLEQDLDELVAEVEKTGTRADVSNIHKWVAYVRELRKDLSDLG